MKTLQLLSLVILIALPACRKAPDYLTSQQNEEVETPTSSEPMPIIRAGTSFGMCMGYCVTELEVVDAKAMFTEMSPRNPGTHPDRTAQRLLNAAELRCLKDAIDMSAFMKLDTIIGCPDCADGGAEWIEIELNGVRRRVTFDHGASIPQIQPLLDRVRSLRTTFKSGSYIYQTWEWVESSGGIAGVTVTPASAGYTQRSIYRSDGTVTFLRNGSPVISTTYTITREKTNFSSGEEDVIRYGDPSVEPQIMRLSGDTLSLTDLCYDCFQHVYKRAGTICE